MLCRFSLVLLRVRQMLILGGMYMIDIDCEVKQYGREGNVGFRKTKCNYSNSYQDVNRYKLAVAQSAKHKDNSPSIAEPVPDAHMSTKENYSVEFSSKSSLDMAVRGLEDLRALFEMRLNEAKSAGDTFAAGTAATELLVVMESLVTLYSASCLLP